MSGMPPPPPRPPGGGGGAADLRRRALLAGRQGMAGPQGGDGQAAAAAQQQQGGGAEVAPRDLSMPLPLPWTPYFDRQLRVHCPERGMNFNAYVAGESGPVVLCLHGGGYTGLSWALIARALKDKHQVVAPDLRSHGLTEAADGPSDFSAATLAADVVAFWKAMFGGGGGGKGGSSGGGEGSNSGGGEGSGGGGGAGPAQQQQKQQQQQQQGGPPTVLVGHSMGGAVAVHAAALAGIPSLAGIVVIDVVEGTALASLPYMNSVLAKRPQRFASLQQAVDWALDTGMCKRQEAAHVSLPSMLRREPISGGSSSSGGSSGEAAGGSALPPLQQGRLPAGGLEVLAEEGEDGEGEEGGEERVAQQQQQAPEQQQQPVQQQRAQSPPPDQQQRLGSSGGGGGGGWVWRTRLEDSAPYWEGWYTGLSELFLKLSVPKVLVLVGTDRLDRSLTIGQMQGKFQPVLLPQAGHAVHEDEPERTADAIATFIRRFRIGEPPLRIPRPVAGMRPVLPVAMGPASAMPPAPAAAAPAAAAVPPQATATAPLGAPNAVPPAAAAAPASAAATAPLGMPLDALNAVAAAAAASSVQPQP